MGWQTSRRITLIAASLGTAAPVLWAEPCQPYWAQGQASTPSTHSVGLVSFDDGSGPSLFAIWGLNQRLYRWRDGEGTWTLAETGMPANYYLTTGLLVLNSGDGSRLYAFVGLYNGVPELTPAMVVWNGASWALCFPGIETANGGVFVSGNIGDGQAIYGIVAGGDFRSNVVVRWAGDHWVPMNAPITYLPDISIITTARGTHLYAIGNFPNCPHMTAMWDGQQWVSAGDADLALINDPITFDDGSGVAAYGWGTATIAGIEYQGLLKFDGQHWTVLGHFDPPGSIQVVRGGLMFDDGPGPAMFLRGDFTNMGGVPANHIARYGLLDHTWSGLGNGLDSGVNGLAAIPTRRGPSLFAIGTFSHAGAGTVNHTAQYVGCPNCYANCDLSTVPPVLNVNDFVCFLYKFAQRVPEANCDNNASIDVNDFVCFLSRFAAGCG